MRPLREIIVHCSATKPDWMAGKSVNDKIEEIRRWHKTPGVLSAKGANDIGYHFVIDRDGKWGTGRPIEQVGAHCRGRNEGSIGICLLGGFGSHEKDPFNKNFTKEQERTLKELIHNLGVIYKKLPVNGHNQYAAKACPGFNAPKWYEETQKSAPVPDPKKPETPSLLEMARRLAQRAVQWR